MYVNFYGCFYGNIDACANGVYQALSPPPLKGPGDEANVKYDENAVKTVSKCLARMKACWDPEFEPSVEDIVDYPMISLWRFSQFAFSSELAFRAGGFPYSVEHVAGQVKINRLKPRAPILYSLRPESQLEKNYSADR